MGNSAATLTAPARQFASDNHSGICPAAWEAMRRAHAGHAAGYGAGQGPQRAAQPPRDPRETRRRALPGDSEQCAHQIGLLLAVRELCRRPGHQAAESARPYRWSSVADRVLDIYRSVGYFSHGERDPIAAPDVSLCAICGA